MRRRAHAIVEAVAPAPDDRLLELGCGTGELAHLMAQHTQASVTGVDLCEPFIARATAAFGGERLSFVAADLSKPQDVERLGRQWRAVVGNGILHHLYYRMDEALKGLLRLLVPGGRFVFWEPNLYNPYAFAIFSVGPLRKLARLEPDEMAFTPAWIRERLQRAGFTDISVSFRDFLLPNLPFSLVPLVTRVGAWAEQVPVVDRLAQSLFIEATAPAATPAVVGSGQR